MVSVFSLPSPFSNFRTGRPQDQSCWIAAQHRWRAYKINCSYFTNWNRAGEAVYALACDHPHCLFVSLFPSTVLIPSATNFSDSAQTLFRENRKQENLLQPSLFAGKENLGLWMCYPASFLLALSYKVVAVKHCEMACQNIKIQEESKWQSQLKLLSL